MKKLINDPQDVVMQSLEGFALAHPDLVTVHNNPTFVVRTHPLDFATVALVSGGGSGHEPLHAGFVGDGMLTAAVPGAMFTSPTPDAIEAAIRAADRGAGVLTIVKNYTGDVMNFDMATELVEGSGIDVRSVVVNDDVAVEDSTWTAGRRGVAGTVFVEKIAGASAARGDDLETVAGIATRVNSHMRSMGVALAGCTVPHAGTPSFDLADDEIEVGIGIHGEPGRLREKMTDAHTIVATLMTAISQDLDLSHGDEVIVLTNGMGATPLSELYLVHREAVQLLAQSGVRVLRSLVGNYVTSLDMQGASLSVLRLDDELLALWDAPVHTAALRW